MKLGADTFQNRGPQSRWRTLWGGCPHGTFDDRPAAPPGRATIPRLAAFSLLEVLIAVVILAVAVVGFTEGFATALASSKDSELQTTAALFAAGQIEILRAQTGLNDETTSGDCGDDLPLYRWRQTVAPADIDGLHTVSVTVLSARTGQTIYELKTMLFEIPGTEPDKSKKSKAVAASSARSGGAARTSS